MPLISFGLNASEVKELIVQPGFSIYAPDGDGWKILRRTQSLLAFGKNGAVEGESYIAAASLYRIPKLNSKEEYLAFVKKGRSNDTDPSRFEIIKNNEYLSKKQTALCVKHDSSAKDKNASYEGKESDYLILDAIGYNCRHPHNNTVGVNFEFTHRHFEETKNSDFSKIAELYLNKLKFTKF